MVLLVKMPEIYSPEEDSYLLLDTIKRDVPKILKKNPNLKFLEIGPGLGILLQGVSDIGVKKENIFSADKNRKAVSHCVKLGFNCRHSDLFKNIKGKFDLIVFNPPYLPLNKDEPKDSRISTTGGKDGSEIINKFLIQAKKHLTKDGKILLLTSSHTKGVNFGNYHKKKINNKKLFFEELFVWELK